MKGMPNVQRKISIQIGSAAALDAQGQPVESASQISQENLEISAQAKSLKLFYGSFLAVKGIDMSVPKGQATALIGPSGCGKSSLLRCFNRMNDLVEGARVEGSIEISGQNIYAKDVNITMLRKRVGMVFQKSNPFPKSIYENVAYGLKIHGMTKGPELDSAVEKSLKNVGLWDEVKDRLQESAYRLSGGQQQRLCIARALAIEPELLLMDEPCSALDPIATGRIEDLIQELKHTYTIIIVTHNMQQAARVSDITGFMLQGELVEFGPTEDIFQNPKDQRTLDYVTGRFG